MDKHIHTHVYIYMYQYENIALIITKNKTKKEAERKNLNKKIYEKTKQLVIKLTKLQKITTHTKTMKKKVLMAPCSYKHTKVEQKHSQKRVGKKQHH